MKFNSEAAPARSNVQAGSKHQTSKTEGYPWKKHLHPSESLSHQVAELSNAVQGIQALLARAFLSGSNMDEESRTSRPVPLCWAPRTSCGIQLFSLGISRCLMCCSLLLAQLRLSGQSMWHEPWQQWRRPRRGGLVVCLEWSCPYLPWWCLQTKR